MKYVIMLLLPMLSLQGCYISGINSEFEIRRGKKQKHVLKKRPRIVFRQDDTLHDVGRIPYYGNVTCDLHFRNGGDEPLVINEIRTETYQTTKHSATADWPHKAIKPGKKGIITVTINAQDESGSFRDRLVISSNAEPGNAYYCTISGSIIRMREQDQEKEVDGNGWFQLLQPVIKSVAN